jgi:protein-S-isoprenylcysteine O-methyltransferase Ste14
MIALGGGLLLDAFARFALQGAGTPAPVLPTRTLVVTGPYRYVRNPMYIAVVTLILGQAVLLGDVALLAYAALVWLATHIFVLIYEEPMMRATYPAEYAVYAANVRRWLPRLTPWLDGIP